MAKLTDVDQATLAGIAHKPRAHALAVLNAFLDGASPALPAEPVALEPVLSAVMAAAGIDEPTDPAEAEEPTEEMMVARQRWFDQRVTVLGALPTLETMFARSADAFLAALVRIAQQAAVETSGADA